MVVYSNYLYAISTWISVDTRPLYIIKGATATVRGRAHINMAVDKLSKWEYISFMNGEANKTDDKPFNNINL